MKKSILENTGLDFLFLQEFNTELKNLEAEDFVEKILVEKLNIKHIIIGYDYRFGKNRKGDYQLLKKMGKILGFEVQKN